MFLFKVNVTSQSWLINGRFSGGYVTQNSLGTEVVQHQSNGVKTLYTVKPCNDYKK